MEVILDTWKKNCLRVTNFVLFFSNTKLSENESEDEGVNGEPSLFSAFKTMLTTRSWCEPIIISMLFEATKEQKFDQKLVKVMSTHLTFRSFSLHLGKKCLRVPNFVLFFNTKLSENESEDSGVNRAASLLSAFKTIVTMSSWCLPKIISLLFEATKEQKFDQELV